MLVGVLVESGMLEAGIQKYLLGFGVLPDVVEPRSVLAKGVGRLYRVRIEREVSIETGSPRLTNLGLISERSRFPRVLPERLFGGSNDLLVLLFRWRGLGAR